MSTGTTEINDLIAAHRAGDAGSMQRLIKLLYPKLLVLARSQLRRMRPGATLNTTSLVHEAYLKFAGRRPEWRDRAHFLAAAATAMRHVLVDAARKRATQKHGDGLERLTLDEGQLGGAPIALEVLEVDRALEQLRAIDERMCRVVECRFFAGMTEEESAEALGVSSRTVHRDWLRARGWLKRQLRDASTGRAAD